MNIISISTDRNIFKEGSAVRARQVEYGQLFDELHVIVFSTMPFEEQIGANTWVYSTSSRSKFLFIRDARRLAKKISVERRFQARNTVVTTQDPFETGLVGLSIKRVLGFKLHVQIHTDFLSPFFARSSFLNRIRVALARRVLPQADGIRVVSERIANSLKSPVFGRTLRVEPLILPIFVDVEKIQRAEIQPGNNLHEKYPQFSFIILMASRLTREKNIPLALRAFAEVVQTHPKAGMVIVGEGPERLRLEGLVQQLGLEAAVVFEPWQHDMPSYYKSADLLLVTSDFEGYGLTIVEAAAARCPVVATDVGVARDFARGDVCAPRDTECLSRTLKAAVTDSGLRQKAIEAAAARLSSSTTTHTTYLEAYKESIVFLLKNDSLP